MHSEFMVVVLSEEKERRIGLRIGDKGASTHQEHFVFILKIVEVLGQLELHRQNNDP